MEAELSHPLVWRFARRMVRKMFPDDREMRLPGKPMRRHHYLYVRNRYLTGSRGAKEDCRPASRDLLQTGARAGLGRSLRSRVVH